MWRDKEAEQELKAHYAKEKMSFGSYLKIITIVLVFSIVFSFGTIGMVHYYFGENGARTFIQIAIAVFVAVLIWLMVIVTSMVANRHTSTVVKNVTQSIVETQAADDRGEVARMMAMIYKQQMGNGQGYDNKPYYPNPIVLDRQNGNYLAKPSDDRFDYEGHLSMEDVWSQSSGLK